jgi:site-specific DNA recombinase
MAIYRGNDLSLVGKRAIGYIRVSTSLQKEQGFSLPEQRVRIEEYCRTHGLTLLEVIADDETGRSFGRPGLDRVMALAEAQAFDCLICVKLDRLGRNEAQRRQFRDRLEARRVRTLFTEQHFDRTSSGRLQEHMMGDFSEYEAAVIRERTMNGRDEKAKTQAMPCYCPVYGLHQISRAEAKLKPELAGKSGKMVLIEAEAEVVARIFRLCAGGSSLYRIARTLNADGLQTRGGHRWTETTVRAILKNETYVGRLHFGKVRVRDTGLREGKKKIRERIPRDRSDWVEIPVPAIVDEELFKRCQRQLEENSARLGGRPTRIWLLHGAIFCGVCTTRTGTPRCCTGHTRLRKTCRARNYRCSSDRVTSSEGFCGATFPAERIETMARDALRRAAEPNRLAEFARSEEEERQRQAGSPEEAVKRLCEALNGLDREEEQLLNEALAAGFSRALIQKRLEALRGRRNELTRDLAATRERLVGAVDPEEAARRGEAAADYLRGALDDAERDPVKLQELFQLFLEVRIFPDGREPEITTRIPLVAE